MAGKDTMGGQIKRGENLGGSERPAIPSAR